MNLRVVHIPSVTLHTNWWDEFFTGLLSPPSSAGVTRQAGGGVIGETREKVLEKSKWFDVMKFHGGDDRVDECRTPVACMRVRKEIALSSERC